MKKILQLSLNIFLLFVIDNKATAQNCFTFNYDGDGNVVQRGLTICSAGARLAFMGTQNDSLPQMRVYPNPTNDYLNVEGKLPEKITKAKIIISSLTGQLMKEGTYAGEAKQIPVYDLAKGMYLLEFIYSKKQKETYKIIVN